MKIIETDLPGCIVIEPQVFGESCCLRILTAR
jgi:hypothetical protein